MAQFVPSDVRVAARSEHHAAEQLADHAAANEANRDDGAVRVVPWAHSVQFYDDLSVLAFALADFLTPGFEAGQSVIVMAGAPCRHALERELLARGFDASLAAADGRVVLADARETLAAFMVDGMPDPERFEVVVGRVLDAGLAASRHPTVRVFGEMVDMLWKDGRADAAIRLEQLWNELAISRPFSLLCAYEMSDFRRAEDAMAFRRICGEHERVIPTDSYTGMSDAMRMREISILQQRARALEFEIEQRKELESQLAPWPSARAPRRKPERRAGRKASSSP